MELVKYTNVKYTYSSLADEFTYIFFFLVVFKIKVFKKMFIFRIKMLVLFMNIKNNNSLK